MTLLMMYLFDQMETILAQLLVSGFDQKEIHLGRKISSAQRVTWIQMVLALKWSLSFEQLLENQMVSC